MKISCLPVSIFGDVCPGKWISWIGPGKPKSMGYDGIDISIMFLENRTPTYLAELKRQLNALQMPIIMMTTLRTFTHPDPVQREREMLYLKADVALSSELGDPISAYSGRRGAHRRSSPARTASIGSATHFTRSTPTGSASGVGLLFENHGKPGAWTMWTLRSNRRTSWKYAAGRRIRTSASILIQETSPPTGRPRISCRK